MGKLRTVLAYVLLAALLATVLVLLERPVGLGAGDFPVTIDGPDGLLWNGTVHVEEATPLSALVEAATLSNLSVGVRGTGAQAYVWHIGGHEEGGTGGWCYAVLRSGSLLSPALGAGSFALQPGDGVRWYWTEDGCLPFTPT